MDQRYFDLLKKKEELGKYWHLDNNREEAKELAYYEASLSYQFTWEQRSIHFELSKMYLDRKINIDKYGYQLVILSGEVIKLAEELKLDLGRLEKFECNSNAELFSGVICYITDIYRHHYEPNPEYQDEFSISEKQFRKKMKSQLLFIEQFREQ
jgi:hypothetical protein